MTLRPLFASGVLPLAEKLPMNLAKVQQPVIRQDRPLQSDELIIAR